MNSVKEIITALDTDILASIELSNIQAYGVVEQVFRQGEGTLPLYIAANGQATEFPLNDRHEIWWYHRPQTVNIEVENGYGNQFNIAEDHEIRLVAAAKRKTTSYSPLTLYQLFSLKLAAEVSAALRSTLGISTAIIAPQRANLIGHNVFSQEFSNPEIKLHSDFVLISIDYLVKIKYTQKCLVLNTCKPC